MKERLGLILLLGCSLALAACGGGVEGPPTYTVSGNVTLDGNPVAEGDIIFRAADGKGRSDAGMITGGTFAFEATAGKKLVAITAVREVPGKFDESNPGEKVPMREQYIPAQYNEKTTLEAEVGESGDNSGLKFELTSEKAP